jgi:hypothetical protein
MEPHYTVSVKSCWFWWEKQGQESLRIATHPFRANCYAGKFFFDSFFGRASGMAIAVRKFEDATDEVLASTRKSDFRPIATEKV